MDRLLAFGRPLLFAMLAVVASFVFALWASQRDLVGIEDEVTAIASNSEPSIMHLDDARSYLEHLGIYAVEYLEAREGNLSTAPSSREQVLLARHGLDRSIHSYLGLSFYPGEEEKYEAVRGALLPVDESIGVVLDRADAGDIAAASAEAARRLRPGIERADALLDELIRFDSDRTQASLASIRRSRQMANVWALGLGTLSLLVSCGATALALLAVQREAARRETLEAERARHAATQAELRTRDDFLSLAAHELRTPLTALQLNVQAIARTLPDPPELVSKAVAQLRRLSDLVEELIEVSQIHLGHLTLVRREVDLSTLVRDVVAERSADAKNARCEVRVAAPPSIVGHWDRTQIAHVLSNLLSNALRFGTGAPVEISVESRDSTARLVVRDHGMGIPRARLPFVFDLFEHAAPSRNYGGLGMGLFVARAVVRAHGGSIDVASSEGDGSTFTIDLPLDVAHDSRRAIIPAEPPKTIASSMNSSLTSASEG
jgi:signal transduction histidine kinase